MRDGVPERGALTTVPELQHQLHDNRVVLPPDTSFDFQALPSLSEIEAYILRSRRHKSPGIDGLPGDVFKVSAPTFARVLWPILTKMALRCVEPLRWKGGEVCSLPKTIAPSHAVDKYRSILLADYASKLAHGVTRQKLLPFFEEFRQPMQAGGVPRLSTDMLSLHVQSFAQYTRAAGLSSAALFVDIRQAFYSICRPFLAKQPLHEADLLEIFVANNWSRDMFQDFLTEIQAPTSLQRAHLSTHMEAQVASTLQATWFQMKGQPTTLTATKAGTRPGDSIADLLFAFLMTRFVQHVTQVFDAAGLSSQFELRWIPPCELSPEEWTQQTVLDASWVDDLVLLIQAASPATLIAKTRCALGLVYDAAVQFGLALNLSKDKVSLPWEVPQPGPPGLRFCTQIPSLQFQCRALAEPTAVAIVPDYVYLGSLHDHSGTPAADLKRKILSVQHLRKILHKGVFKNPKVPMRTRSMIFQSLVMSRLQYNIGAWQHMHMHTARSWQTQVITLYSQLHSSLKRGPHVHSLDIVAGSRQIHPMLVLGTNRLRLFDRLTQVEMAPLWSVLQAQPVHNGWLAMVCQDLLRVLQYVDRPAIAEMAQTGARAQLAQHSFRNPGVFSKLANQRNVRYLKYLDIWTSFRQFLKQFDCEATAHGVTWHQDVRSSSTVDTFVCQTCDASFASYKALCTHVYKVHQVVNVAHRYAWGSRCQACLKQFHSNVQLIHHLKYFHTGCLIRLIFSINPMDDQELATNVEEQCKMRVALRKQQRCSQHKQPVIRASGPLRPWPWDRVNELVRQDTRDLPQIHADALTIWREEVIESLDCTDLPRTFEAISQVPYHAEFAAQVQAEFTALHLAMKIAPSPFHAEKQLILQEAIGLWQNDAHVPSTRYAVQVDIRQALASLHQVRIQQVATTDMPSVSTRRDQLQDDLWNDLTVPVQIHHQLDVLHHRTYQWVTPEPVRFTQTPVCLYVYSGRRRDGDFQQYAEQYIDMLQLTARVLLIDLALSDHHDATSESLVGTLLRWMRGGAVAGLLVAPPCETWSEARNLPGTTSACPRPIRTADQPFEILG